MILIRITLGLSLSLLLTGCAGLGSMPVRRPICITSAPRARSPRDSRKSHGSL